MMLFLAKYWRQIALVAFLVAVLGAVWFGGVRHGVAKGERAVRASEVAAANDRADAAEDRAKAAEDQAKRYQTRAESQAAIATQYQEALLDANRKHDSTVADLRAGNLKLRDLWRGCKVPASGQAPAGGPEPDGEADDRAESAARIVRAAATCDAHVVALQAILTGERQ